MPIKPLGQNAGHDIIFPFEHDDGRIEHPAFGGAGVHVTQRPYYATRPESFTAEPVTRAAVKPIAIPKAQSQQPATPAGFTAWTELLFGEKPKQPPARRRATQKLEIATLPVIAED